jgi:quercetin dioxygenase-like cupin family protein
MTTTRGLRVIGPSQWGPDLGIIDGGTWREIVGPTTNARCRSLYQLEMSPGARSRALVHSGEAVYYVVDGAPAVTQHHGDGTLSMQQLDEGAMVHVRPRVAYSFTSVSGSHIVGGPSPVDAALGTDSPPTGVHDPGGVRLFHRDRPGLLVPFISADARLVVWLGEGAVTANMNYVVLQPGERNREHVHTESEDTIHVLRGRGTAENVTTGESIAFGPGDTIHIEIGIWHAIAADRGETVISVGGPCPADTNMLRAAGVDVEALTASVLSH